MSRRKASPRRKEALRKGFASGLELDIAEQLDEAGEAYDYEKEALEIWLEVPKNQRIKCKGCEGRELVKNAKYTPDFFLKSGIIIESKGRFTAVDRRKALAVKQQHPELDYRMLFQFNNPLTKGGKNRYSDWCIKHDIKYAVGKVPEEWLS